MSRPAPDVQTDRQLRMNCGPCVYGHRPVIRAKDSPGGRNPRRSAAHHGASGTIFAAGGRFFHPQICSHTPTLVVTRRCNTASISCKSLMLKDMEVRGFEP